VLLTLSSIKCVAVEEDQQWIANLEVDEKARLEFHVEGSLIKPWLLHQHFDKSTVPDNYIRKQT